MVRKTPRSRELPVTFPELMFAVSTDLTYSNWLQVVILVDLSSSLKMPLKLLTKFSELTVSRVSRRLDISSKEDQWIVLILLESSTLIKSKAN